MKVCVREKELKAMRTLHETTKKILELATKDFKLASGFLKVEDAF